MYPPAKWCSLAEYRDVVGNLPRPTDAQVDDFVQFLSTAHSWYKLPIFPPGIPFRFFVDPAAGCWRHFMTGDVTFEVQTEAMHEEFHHTRMPTAAYVARFGYLSWNRGPFPGGHLFSGELEWLKRPVFGNNGIAFHTPLEIAIAGMVGITSVIHPRLTLPWIWERVYERTAHYGRGWPEETGGSETLDSIISLAKLRPAIAEDYEQMLEEFAALFVPERQRLQQTMRDGIHRMLDLAYGEKR